MKMDKKLSASRGLRPADHQQGLCPWTPLGAPTPTPVIDSSSVLAKVRPLANPGSTSEAVLEQNDSDTN